MLIGACEHQDQLIGPESDKVWGFLNKKASVCSKVWLAVIFQNDSQVNRGHC